MKKGLCKGDIKKYHRYLKAEIPLKKIAKQMHTTVDVLKALSPEKMAKAEAYQKMREKRRVEINKKNADKAKVLAETAANILNETDETDET